MNTVLITGCSSGIGKAIALHLKEQNWKVYAGVRKSQDLNDLEDLGLIAVKVDVTKQATIDHALHLIQANDGKLDALINNAGFGQFGVFEYVNDQQARQQFDVNVFGLANVTRSALPLLRKSADPRIVNISSIAGHVSLPFSAWYCASKSAVEAITDSLRMELSTQKIKLISIQPGPIESNFGTVMREQLVIPEPDGVYDRVVEKALAYFKGDFGKKPSAKPAEVVRAVMLALTSKKPKTRYRVTPIAKSLVILKKVLPDKVIDAVFLKKMGLN